VEDANRRFYEAFASGRIEAMAAVWGRGDHVQTIHPGAGVISGRDDVIESWRAVLKGVRPRAFRITAEDVRVYASDAHGYVTCTEVVEADDARGRTAATNIFEKQGGKWVMTHHHGSPLMMGRR
jgi:translation initiation factor 2A